MKPMPHEINLTGNWIPVGKKVEGDEVCHRIDWLIQSHLRKLAVSKNGWEILYCDPEDGRLWEKTYPRSEMHGGGPPSLRIVTCDEARTKYQF